MSFLFHTIPATTNKDIAADLKSCFFTGTKKSRNVNVKQLILEFLDEFKIKIDGEFIDEAKHERLLRQNELSIEHSKEDYLVYEKSRSVSFDSWKHQREFNEWLGHKLKNNPGKNYLMTKPTRGRLFREGGRKEGEKGKERSRYSCTMYKPTLQKIVVTRKINIFYFIYQVREFNSFI